jgi:predicted amidohydrolase
VIAKYRKVHLPGTKEPFENPDAINQLEKRYFEPGNLGFKAFRAHDLVLGAQKKGAGSPRPGQGDPIMGMMICNDRRWAEGWRCYGLQGVEIVLCGYNTAGFAPDL